LGFIHRPAKFQKLGLTPSNSLKFFTRLRRVNARLILNLYPKWLNVVSKITFYAFVKLHSCRIKIKSSALTRIVVIDFSSLKHIINNASLPEPPADASYQSTCVFLLLFGEKEPYILFIQKSDREGYPWRNQVALPGGHVDKEDKGPVDTAFRELEEELNISRNQVELIGSMGHFQTIQDKDIEVFIGLWNGKGPVRYDSEEIARVIEIPLKDLVRTHVAANFRGRLPATRDLVYPLKGVVIWGVTARILHYFIELLYPFPDTNEYLTD